MSLDRRRPETPKKLELVALIDVIFLLLIFFLVTMNIIPGFGEVGKQERQFPIDAPGKGKAKIDALIQVHRPTNTPNGRIYYVVVNRALVEDFIRVPFDDQATYQELTDYLTTSHVFASLDDLNIRDMGTHQPPAKTAVIRCGPWVEYGEVLKVVEKCRQQGVTPVLAQGTLASMSDNVEYSDPAGWIAIEP